MFGKFDGFGGFCYYLTLIILLRKLPLETFVSLVTFAWEMISNYQVYFRDHLAHAVCF